MNDERTADLLEEIVRRECRSILQYVSESYPWVTPEEQAALAQVQKMTAEEQQGAAALARHLVRRHHRAPYLGSYPMDFTTINFVSLEHLLPVLADCERRAVARLERDLAGLTDPEARGLVQAILNTKRGHLQTIESLARSAAAGAVSTRT